MVGKTILHLPRGIKESVLVVSTTKKLKADMQMNPNVLSNGVNKILEKLGEGPPANGLHGRTIGGLKWLI
jgi:hypothetical protein